MGAPLNWIECTTSFLIPNIEFFFFSSCHNTCWHRVSDGSSNLFSIILFYYYFKPSGKGRVGGEGKEVDKTGLLRDYYCVSLTESFCWIQPN
jgi:hypothetical protein